MSDSSWSVSADLTATDNISPAIRKIVSSLTQGQAALDKFAASAKALGGSSADITKLDQSFRALTLSLNQNAQAASSAAAALNTVNTAGKNAGTGLGNATKAVKGLHASAGPAREAVVLLHEAISGRFSRIPGSLMVLGEYFSGVLTPATLGWAAAIGAAALATYELLSRWHEVETAVSHAQGISLMQGSLTPQTEGESRSMIDTAKNTYGASNSEAAKAVEEIRRAGGAAEQFQQQLLKAAIAEQALTGGDLDKIAQSWAKAANSGAESFLKFAEAQHQITEQAAKPIRPIAAGGYDDVNAFKMIMDSLNATWITQGSNIAAAKKDMSDYLGYVASVNMGGFGMPMGVPDEITPPSAESQKPQPQGPAVDPAQQGRLKAIDDETKAEEERAAKLNEIKVLQQALAAGEKGSAEALATAYQSLGRIHTAAETQAHDEIIAGLDAEIAKARNNEAEKIALIKQRTDEDRRYELLAVSGVPGGDTERAEAQRAVLAASNALKTDGVALSNAEAEAVTKAAEAQRKADELHKQALENQLRQLEQITRAQPEGSQGRINAAQNAASFAQANFPAGSSQIGSADDELAAAKKEAADQAAAVAKSNAQTDIELSKMVLEAKKADLQGEVAEGAISAAQRLDQLKSLAAQELALDLSANDQEQAAEKNNVVQFAEALNQRRKLMEQYTIDVAKLNEQQAAEAGKAWAETNKQIADALSSGLIDALTGKKGGFGAAIQQWVRGELSKDLSSALSSGFSGIENMLGVQGQGPGALLNSGLSAIGLGGVGKFLGLGGGAGDPGQQANTTALGVLTLAVNTNTAALQASSATNLAGEGDLTANAMNLPINITGEGGSGGGIGSIFGNIGSFFSSILPGFASGGAAYKPSIVGENGPELFNPGGGGQITSNDNLRKALSLPSGGAGINGYSPRLSVDAGDSTVTNNRGGDVHNYNFRQTNHVETAANADHADAISRMSSRELTRFARQAAGRR